jgi:hypothetical protein
MAHHAPSEVAMGYALAVFSIIGGIIAITLLKRHWRRVDDEIDRQEMKRRAAKALRDAYGPELTDEEIREIFSTYRSQD